ncbi:MAG: NnrS family protein [Proteobacteria bacterium]|nr:NnrS family protein [Pseudomonadota bacterium]
MAGKQTPGDKRRAYSGPAILSHGFRPFFFMAGLWAAFAMPLWLWLYTAAPFPFLTVPAPVWHAHEMIFGYLAAVLTGFLLTAIPNWTGRLPIMGAPLLGLVLLWLSGRLALWFLPGQLAAAVDCAFLIVVALIAWREVMVGKNWRNAPVCVLVSLMALANILFWGEFFYDLPAGLGQRLGLAVAGTLITLIGGRIVPSFTRNWMKQMGFDDLPAELSAFDKASVLATVLAFGSWVAFPDGQGTAYLMALAGVLLIFRLFRWKGAKTFSEPLVLVLHIGYAWVPVSLLLLSGSIFFPADIPYASALHALTAGAVGLMTVGVMTRAALGHSGRPRVAGLATSLIYVLIFSGALIRVAAPVLPFDYGQMIMLSGVLFSLGFALFAIRYAPIFFGR